ncbi:MAG: hypothetical protein U0183_26485 [Polyangiaceae bacterium]
MTLTELGTMAYVACVDVELALGRALGLSYRDINAGLFFVLFPLATLALGATVVGQGLRLRGLRRAEKMKR